VQSLPEMPEAVVTVTLEGVEAPVTITADPVRLRTALAAVLTALRREVIHSEQLIVRHLGSRATTTVAIASPGDIDALAAAEPTTLEGFDEWRGGSGLCLPIARRIITQHGGALLAPPGNGRAAALLTLPRA
jgi:hypothetical protein